jgi:hypothetical protein
LEKKKQIWQEKQAEFLNNLIKQKKVKKVWEAVRNILKKKDIVQKIGLNILVNYCNLLFGLYPSSQCSSTTVFQGRVLPLSLNETYSVRSG